jgi:signal transduction histidine kinase
MASFRFRFLWLVTLGSLALATLCAFTALSLFRQQTAIAHVMRENVVSRRAAMELEECLLDLIALLNDRVESVSALHGRARLHLAHIQEVSDQPEEKELYQRLHSDFDRYLTHWATMPPAGSPGHEPAVREARRLLESDVLKPCLEFEQYNARRIEESTQHHERVLRQLGWGMAGVAGLGWVAGMVLGFGVARGLSRSIRRLQVQIRDAEGKLGDRSPEIVLTGEGDLGRLEEQIGRLTGRIEAIVGELQQREREVLRAEQLAAVGQLAAGVAHEIRNPLTSIKMLVQAGLEDGGGVGLADEDLAVIEREIRRLERSLKTFLDFARPPKPLRRPVDLLAVVGAVVGLIRGRADKQRVDVRLDAPRGGVSLTADPEQIQQVLVNLALNALDAMPTGGTLSFAVRRAGNRRVVIEVGDTGGGIPADLTPRLFQPFVSGKDTGLGLGLVISRRIVEDHGGAIVAANRPGGACFTISLPGDPPH